MNAKDTSAYFLLWLLSLFAVVLPAHSFGQVIQTEPRLAAYIQEGLTNNPDLEVWRNKVDASEHEIPQAGAWSDPTVSLGFMNIPLNSFRFNQEPMTGIWLNAGQMIPLAGKPGIKTDIAEYNLESTRHDKHIRELSITSALAHTWYDWAYLQAALETVETNIELLDNMVIVALKKYETGQGMQQDILRAETKRTQLEDIRAGITQMTLTTNRRFALLLGRTEISDLQEPSDLLNTFSVLNKMKLSENMMALNPSYLRMKSELNASESKSELARRAWYPDLKLGAGYGFRQAADNGMERPDFFTITAGVSVPVFGSRKQGEAIQEMLAMERAIQAKLRSLELNLQFQLDKLLDEDQRLAEQILLYLDGIEPQAEATFAASTSSYSVGKADFEALLMAETALYNARLQRLARIRDRLKVRVSIAALMGGGEFLKETTENE